MKIKMIGLFSIYFWPLGLRGVHNQELPVLRPPRRPFIPDNGASSGTIPYLSITHTVQQNALKYKFQQNFVK